MKKMNVEKMLSILKICIVAIYNIWATATGMKRTQFIRMILWKFIMKISMKFTKWNFIEKNIGYQCQCFLNMNPMKRGDYLEIENLASIYKEIACTTNVSTAVEMYNLFKGQQIIFPQRLYNKEFISAYVKENFNGHNIRELSQMFGYSDRRIRQILNQN